MTTQGRPSGDEDRRSAGAAIGSYEMAGSGPQQRVRGKGLARTEGGLLPTPSTWVDQKGRNEGGAELKKKGSKEYKIKPFQRPN